MAQQMRPIIMEDVRIIFRNFEGKEGLYNKNGDRGFSIVLDPADAEAMRRDGWKVKALKPREEGDEPGAHLEIAVRYDIRPPEIWLVTSKRKTLLGEAELNLLDFVEIVRADLQINPYQWGPMADGATGIKAYLGALWVTIDENPLQERYADIPVSGR